MAYECECGKAFKTATSFAFHIGGCSVSKARRRKTPKEALDMLIKEISAYRGSAIERAVHGVIGAAAALEAIGAISQDEAFDYRQKAREAGVSQREKTTL